MSKLTRITIGNLLNSIADKYGNKDALVYTDRPVRLNYSQLNSLCNEVAKGLIKLGIKKGDHIAILATNIPQWVILQFAAAKIGAVLVTVNPNYRIFELEFLLKHSDVTSLFLIHGFKGSDYIEQIYRLCPELKYCEPGKLESESFPKLKNIIYLEREKFTGMFNWENILELGKSISNDVLEYIESTLNPDDVINIQYTSGTTGSPKGVMLTHYNLINNAISIGDCMNLTSEDRLCIPVPFFHCFGCVLGILTCVAKGACMVPIEQFNPLKVMEAVQKEKCTALHGVPTMFISILEHPNFNQYNLKTLRTGIMAGSPCPEKVMKDVIEKMGMKEITIAYGQTESSPVITQTRTTDPINVRISTVGREIPNVEVKIIDPKTGDEVPTEIPGELCTRGYHVMKGYYKNEEATNKVIDADGWLHTGDLAIKGIDGNYRIVGRIKDMIIRGGENIYPKEIEEYLYKHPAIKDAQVVGVPSKKFGEEVAACIILKEGLTLGEKELRKYLYGKISTFKIPRYIKFMESYPMTASGKIQKYKLREILIKELGLENEAS